MYELKKIGKVFTSKFVGTGPLSYKKKNLPGRGLTKVEKHCSTHLRRDWKYLPHAEIMLAQSLFLLITNLTHFLMYLFISLLYTFRATRCSPSGESIVLVLYIIWHVSLCVGDCLVCRSWTGIPGSHLHSVIHTGWCIKTIRSPDDEHRVTRNMQRREIH